MCSLPVAQRLTSHPVDTGQRTEAVILAELVKRGHTVLTPFGVNHRYDFVLDCGDHFLRAQCKTGRLREGVVLFPTQSTRRNTHSLYSRSYRGEIDLFLVYCPDTEKVYAVPVDEVAATGGFLRVAEAANGQSKGIRWAATYELSG